MSNQINNDYCIIYIQTKDNQQKIIDNAKIESGVYYDIIDLENDTILNMATIDLYKTEIISSGFEESIYDEILNEIYDYYNQQINVSRFDNKNIKIVILNVIPKLLDRNIKEMTHISDLSNELFELLDPYNYKLLLKRKSENNTTNQYEDDDDVQEIINDSNYHSYDDSENEESSFVYKGSKINSIKNNSKTSSLDDSNYVSSFDDNIFKNKNIIITIDYALKNELVDLLYKSKIQTKILLNINYSKPTQILIQEYNALLLDN